MLNIFVQSLHSATKHWRWAVAWAVINFSAATLMAIPVQRFVQRINHHSRLGERLLHSGLDFAWAAQVSHQEKALELFAPNFTLTFLAVTLLYLVLSIFLTGGMIGLFQKQREGQKPVGFFVNCVRFFRPLLGAAAMSWFFYAAAFLGVNFLVYLNSKFAENATTQLPVNSLEVALLCLALLVFGFVQCFFDYVKVGLVLTNPSNVTQQVVITFVLMMRYGWKILGLFSLTCGLWLLVSLFSIRVVLTISQQDTLTLLIGLVLQQVVMILRGWMRLVFLAGECDLYRHLIPIPETIPQEISAEASQMI